MGRHQLPLAIRTTRHNRALVADHEGLPATVDLAAQKVTVHAPDPVIFSFEMGWGGDLW